MKDIILKSSDGVLGRRDVSESKRKPLWLKASIPKGDNYLHLKTKLREKGLFTVCEEAKCPNLSECWSGGTATIMILGDTCTRACKFCHVKTGNPKGFINESEIADTSLLIGMMTLRYVVITSVDRDDLPDHGAKHFADVIARAKLDHPNTKIEVLIPDFDGSEERMRLVAEAAPFVIAQNIETVKRLTHVVRDRRAGYEKTLNCLKFYKTHYPHISTKTSIQLGHGESWDEVQATLEDLRDASVDIVTFGQYLRPTSHHLDVKKFYTPEEFEEAKRMAMRMGFKFVASGPLVRSSYKAADFLDFVEALQ
ncbi:MAG: lipoyl synthase [Bacteriovoracaceae bacterium]|nr:lipoyl synthase [Bacteriovoracaceae bacterium]